MTTRSSGRPAILFLDVEGGWGGSSRSLFYLIEAMDRETALREGRRLVQGRLAAASIGATATQYNPVGYVLSAAKDNEAETLDAREQATRQRQQKVVSEARTRLGDVGGGSKARLGT